MRKAGLALCLFLLGLAPAQSQPTTTPVTTGVAGAYNTSTVTCTNPNFCYLQTDVNGNLKITGTVTSSAPVGSANLATSQASVTTGNILVAAARTGRQAVKITNATGTSVIYCGNTGVSTTTGDYIGSTAGSNVVYNTSAAIFCTVAAITQTVTVSETY